MSFLPATPSAIRRPRSPLEQREPQAVVTFDSRAGALWSIVIAVVFVWLSNPLAVTSFDVSLRNASVLTLGALVLTPARRAVRLPWAAAAVLGFIFLTMFWSTRSILSFHFALLYLALAIIALALRSAVDARTIAHGVLLGGVVYVAASALAHQQGLPLAAIPGGGKGYLAGIGGNRNILSYTMILALAFAISFVPTTWRGRGLWVVGLGGLFLGLFLSQSATGLVAAALLLGAAAILGWRDRTVGRTGDAHRGVGWATWLVPVAVLAAAAVLFRVVTALRGEDTVTLSGRTSLWSATWQSVEGWDRFLGAGGGTVWQRPWLPAGENELHAEIVTLIGIWQPHGHNSFFDLLPEIGLVGCLLVALVHVDALWRAVRMRRTAEEPTRETLEASRVILLGLLALLIYGLTEPMTTIPLGWFVLVLLASDLAPGRRRALSAAQP